MMTNYNKYILSSITLWHLNTPSHCENIPINYTHNIIDLHSVLCHYNLFSYNIYIIKHH